MLGNMYYDGIGVMDDGEQAAHWFKLAAKQGLAEAQFKLGVIYYDGDDVSEDDEEAARWIKLAADQGHEPNPASMPNPYSH